MSRKQKNKKEKSIKLKAEDIFKKINKIEKPLIRLITKKKERLKLLISGMVTNTSYDIIIDSTNVKNKCIPQLEGNIVNKLDKKGKCLERHY